jgi:hypothetical protein
MKAIGPFASASFQLCKIHNSVTTPCGYRIAALNDFHYRSAAFGVFSPLQN